MKISELIRRLELAKKYQGDVEVRIQDTDYGTRSVEELRLIGVVGESEQRYLWEAHYFHTFGAQVLDENEEVRPVILLD